MDSRKKYDKMTSFAEEIIAINPEFAEPYNTLAWLYVTSSNSLYYKPMEGLKLAQKAVELKRDANNLDTLAVAFAANDNFEKAIEIEQEAINLATDEQSKVTFLLQIEGFREGKTYLQQKNTVNNKVDK